MRWLPTLGLSLLVTVSAFAAEVKIVRIWPQWRNADAFDRIGEYFGRPESRRDVVVRSRPDQRAGLYFLVRLEANAAPTNGRVILDVIRPDSPDPKQFTFPFTLGAKTGVVEVGLTGEDWPGGREVHPVAWKLSVVDASGSPLATQQSFLWENPEK